MSLVPGETGDGRSRFAGSGLADVALADPIRDWRRWCGRCGAIYLFRSKHADRDHFYHILRQLRSGSIDLFFRAIRKARVAKPDADRGYAPSTYILHKGDFGQSLDHGVIVNHDHSLMLSNSRNRASNLGGKVKFFYSPSSLRAGFGLRV